MKIKKLFIGVFVTAFLVGCFAFVIYVSLKTIKPTALKSDSSAAFVEQESKMKLETTISDSCCYRDDFVPTSPIAEDLPEEDFTEEFEPYTIDMLNTGEFHGDEVLAKSGEKWLALFNDGGKSSLVWTKIKVSWVRDGIMDGENEKFTGKKVSVKSKFEPIFLLKNAPTLKAGKAVTLFDSRKIPEDDQYEKTVMQNGFKKDFVLNGKTFTLKVVNKNSTDEYISNGTKLVLTSGDVEQIVYPNSGERVGEFWYLYWAGDIDGDGKLDFYADVSDHYNSSMPTLFLSSEAEKGKLVKEVAGMRTVGC